MSAILFTYNQRVGRKKLAVTECEENPLKCYTWFINETKPVRKDGVQVIYYRCTGCYAMRVKWKKQDVPLEDFPLPMMKADGVKCVWIDEVPSNEHFCQTKKRSEIAGLEARRSMLAELATGTRETTSSAVVRTEQKLLVSNAFSRAKKKKKFPVLADFSSVMDDENFLLHCTARGSFEFFEEHEKYGERLLIFDDDNMLIFSSPRQLSYMRTTKKIVADGNFKYSADGTYQVYKNFGFVRKIHSTPLVTVLLKRKDGRTYRRMWRKLAAELDVYGSLKLEYAHFDNEPAVYKAFQRQFPDVEIKMCSFDVKHDLNKQVQTKGLAVQYRDDTNVQDVIRMLGALQLAPKEVWNHSLIIIAQQVRTKFDPLGDVAAKLFQIIDYFSNMALAQRLFSLYGMQGQKTTNTSESYHGKLGHYFRIDSSLGEWIVNFKEVPLHNVVNEFYFCLLLQHAEEENASDVNHKRQPPRKQSQDSAGLSLKIAEAQEQYAIVLDQQLDDENFEEHLTSFLLNIGYLMGYNNWPGEIVDGEIGADPAFEDAINNEEEARIAVENIEFNLY